MSTETPKQASLTAARDALSHGYSSPKRGAVEAQVVQAMAILHLADVLREALVK